MIGSKFNKWTVLSEVRKYNRKYYQCICDCGTYQIITSYTLTHNKSKQCRNCSFRTHGLSKTRTYKIWAGMIGRCSNPNSTIFHRYGGRGIKVSERWLKYENFLEDMGECPANLELDRINNNGNYEPGNCRWVTRKENINNIPRIDTMIGLTFGKWKVLERVIHKPDHWYYKCICECGTQKIIAGGELRRRRTTQCHSCKNISHRGWSIRREKVNGKAFNRNKYQTE